MNEAQNEAVRIVEEAIVESASLHRRVLLDWSPGLRDAVMVRCHRSLDFHLPRHDTQEEILKKSEYYGEDNEGREWHLILECDLGGRFDDSYI